MDIVPVLHDRFKDWVNTCDVIVGKLNPSKSLEVMNVLKRTYPIEELHHLKRIRSMTEGDTKNLYVVICCYSDKFKENISLCLSEDVLKENVRDLQVLPVPASQPLTRRQFEIAKNTWPTVFHEDKYITKLQTNNFFSSKELERIKFYMLAAIDSAKAGLKQNMKPVGAVIVDPVIETVIVKSFDCTLNGDPLQHAVMVCIDHVSKKQCGQGMKCSNKINDHMNCSDIRCQEHECKNEASTLQMSGSNSKESAKDENCVTSHEMSYVEGEIESSSEVSKNRNNGTRGAKRKLSTEEQYLCTGYDLYTTHEPCVMCAMALTHSRIHRVFYGIENAAMGGLGSVFKIHCQDGLNHHYEVFKNVLKDRCLALMEAS